MKFLAHSEKPRDVWRIGKVQFVHPLFYKYSIGVRGIFKGPNGNNRGQRIPCNKGFIPMYRDPHLALYKGGCASYKRVPNFVGFRFVSFLGVLCFRFTALFVIILQLCLL